MFQVDHQVTVTTAVPELRKMMKSLGGWAEKTEIVSKLIANSSK